MDVPEDRSKALNEEMSSGFAPRADIGASCRHVRFVPEADNQSRESRRDRNAGSMLSSGEYSMPQPRMSTPCWIDRP
jgi:hypothetical protein